MNIFANRDSQHSTFSVFNQNTQLHGKTESLKLLASSSECLSVQVSGSAPTRLWRFNIRDPWLLEVESQFLTVTTVATLLLSRDIQLRGLRGRSWSQAACNSLRVGWFILPSLMIGLNVLGWLSLKLTVAIHATKAVFLIFLLLYSFSL